MGLKGGWRDCCIVIAPERSGSWRTDQRWAGGGFLSPCPLSSETEERGIRFGTWYLGWRSFLAYPRLPSETPSGVFELARTWCAEIWSRLAFVVAKRWGVRCGASGSQRDRLRVEGSLARWLRRGRSNCEGVSRSRQRGVGSIANCQPQVSATPVAKHSGWRGPAAVVRLSAVGGVVVGLCTPPRAEWLTLPTTERARRAESSTWLSTPPEPVWWSNC